MFEGQKVKIRLKKNHSEQKMRVFVGRVLHMSNGWLKVEGKFYTLVKGERMPRIDEKNRILGIPRENISIIRILPQDIDFDNLQYTIKDNRLMISVGDNQPVSISE